ncbi:MAG: putative pterin-4-alpha-carbinolamine dehydratase [Armatimonadota bacterium]|nr:MAG: putative pterin-4-alpha-carbinolamine dehydratase [Armatimonadota bacterium]
MSGILSDSQIQEKLASLTGWRQEGKEIVRTYEFPTFPEAIAFVDRVAQAAEEANHHPDIDIRYTRVTLRLTSHDSGGLTERDFALAERADALA